MSKPENPQNEQLSDSEPWVKIERRGNLEKKSECPALLRLCPPKRNIHEFYCIEN